MTFRERYRQEVIPRLMAELHLPRVAVPKITSVVVHVGLGKVVREPKVLETIEQTLRRITGQHSVPTTARKSIAGFKIRQGQVIGRKVTLRGKRMDAFLEKLIHVSLPRVRDFRGLDMKHFDGHGNYSIGLREHTVFPEIRPDEVEHIHGLELNINTNAVNDVQGSALLRALGFPFRKV